MNVRLFDIETDNLLDKVTKIHCLSYFDLNTGVKKTVTTYHEIREVFKDDCIWAGHNITRYDFPILFKLLGIPIPEFIIDTLPLSWYLFPERKRHGLEDWGEDLGVQKPLINDWNNLTIKEYTHRCETDVVINHKLWQKQLVYFRRLYPTLESFKAFLEYINFKMRCVLEQEETGLKLDIEYCAKIVEELEKEEQSKTKELESVMPKVAVKKTKSYTDVKVAEDGNVYTKGDLFFDSTKAIVQKELKLSKITGWEDPNSNSNIQLKEWLYTLGWVPEHIKHVRNKENNTVKKIPQIASKQGEGEVCPSIVKLFEKEPKLEVLSGLTVLTHRIGVLKGFLTDQKDGVLYPTMAGLTNTLRLKHKVVVNLPAVEKKYGKEIRSCLVANDDCVLIGSDMTNIEDRTKRHYIYKYDSKYVEDMNILGYDAHLEIAVLAEFMTIADMEFYKNYEKRVDSHELITDEEKKRFNRLKAIRTKAKITNFSATYKVGAEALARNAGIPLSQAKKLLKIYWERNKAILQVEKECKVISIGMDKWLQNPISKFWYSLRNEKDRFSTLNQGTAVYLFDMWVMEIRKLGIKVNLQYHDEILFNCPEDQVETTKQLIREATENVNKKIPLNVPIGCSIQVGKNYASVH